MSEADDVDRRPSANLTAQGASPFSLAGRSVLVTGASSGIGRAVAVAVSRLGGRVAGVACHFPQPQGTLTLTEGTRPKVQSADLLDLDRLPPLLRDLEGAVGPFAGIVHAAGTLRPKVLRMVKPDDFETAMRLHVQCAAALLSHVARTAAPAGSGCSVVLLGSILSTLGSPGLAAYSSAKAALVGLARTAALELAAKRVRVNAILSGFVETPMTRALGEMLGQEHLAKMTAKHPLGLGQPEDIANAVTFLLSDASRWITGACVSVDGGYSAE